MFMNPEDRDIQKYKAIMYSFKRYLFSNYYEPFHYFRYGETMMNKTKPLPLKYFFSNQRRYT